MADKVRFGKGVTINVGNYESVRLDLERETEVEPNEDVGTAFVRVKTWVDRVLDEEEHKIRGNRR